MDLMLGRWGGGTLSKGIDTSIPWTGAGRSAEFSGREGETTVRSGYS